MEIIGILDMVILKNMSKKLTKEFINDILRIVKVFIKSFETVYKSFLKIRSDFMRSISEVAKLLHVHTQTLRNWEKKGLILPNRIGKVRVYSTFDIQRLQQIKKYSGRGIHSRGIRELLRLNSQHHSDNGGQA